MNPVRARHPQLPVPVASASQASPERSRPGGPSAELLEGLQKLSSSALAWEPVPPSVYAKIPELGRRLQAGFYARLSERLAAHPTVRAGEVLVVTSARNEETAIGQTLDNLVTSVASDPKTRLAVVVNASSDGTLDAIRRFARDNAARVELVDGVAPAPAPSAPGPARVRLHLFEEPTPGKTHGLLKVRDLFAAEGSYPEWIAQVDADTKVGPGAVAKLVRQARERHQIAASGNMRKVRPDGQPLIIPEKPPEGSFQHQTLSGGFCVVQTLPWVAGYEAILRHYPANATEDTLLSVMLRAAGFRTGPRGDASWIPAETFAPTTKADAQRQVSRWLTGKMQLDAAYSPAVLKALGLRPKVGREFQAAAQRALVGALHRPGTGSDDFSAAFPDGESSFAPATARARDAIRLSGLFISAAVDARRSARKAGATTPYEWVPGRD